MRYIFFALSLTSTVSLYCSDINPLGITRVRIATSDGKVMHVPLRIYNHFAHPDELPALSKKDLEERIELIQTLLADSTEELGWGTRLVLDEDHSWGLRRLQSGECVEFDRHGYWKIKERE